jgi:hypothetical protein
MTEENQAMSQDPKHRRHMPDDEARIAQLQELARQSADGKVGVRQARRALGVSWEAARRLLDITGLRRHDDTA